MSSAAAWICLLGILCLGVAPAAQADPRPVTCIDALRDSLERDLAGYAVAVERGGAASEEARSLANAMGGHFSAARAAAPSAVWFRRGRHPADPGHEPDAIDAYALQGLGWALVRLDSLEAAEEVLTQAVALWKTVAGPASPCEGVAWERLANCYQSGGRYPKALEAYEEALRILDSGSGDPNPAALRARHGYANTLARQGRATEALPHYRRVWESRTRTLGPDDPDLGWICNDYALALHTLGRFAEAEPLYARAAASRQGRFPSLFRQSAMGLAQCLLGRGDLQGAQAALMDVLDERGEPNRRDTAAALRFLGSLRLAVGDYGPAEDLYRAARDTMGTNLARDRHLDAAIARGEAEIARHRGDLGTAETRQRHAADVLEAMYGPSSVYALSASAVLAEILATRGMLEEADTLFRNVLRELAAQTSDDGLFYGMAARKYAAVQWEEGQREEALTTVRSATAALARALPEGHIERIQGHELASRIYLESGLDSLAWAEAEEAERQGRRHFLLALPGLTETQALTYRRVAPRGLAVLLNLLGEDADGERTTTAWEALMSMRGSVAEDLRRRRLATEDPEAGAVWRDLVREQNHLGTLLTRGPEEGPRAHYATTLAAAEQTVRELDERFTRLTAVSQAPAGAVAVDQLKEKSRTGTSLVAYVQYETRLGDAGSSRYGAFVVSPNLPAPEFFPLVGVQALDAMTDELREHLRTCLGRLRFDPDSVEAEYRAIGTRIRKAIWDPIASRIDLLCPVFVVPDGELWRLNLDALPGPDGSYLVEHTPEIRVIQDESCFATGTGRSPARRGIAVVGGVDYDACGDGDGAVDGPEYTALPYAGDEAKVVADLWDDGQSAGDPVILLQGGDATESATRHALKEAGVVHLATHAFRLEREGVSATEAATWSGVALAGANHGGCAPDEDGVLTIGELAHLDLRTTELVFLSSCGSGLGVLLPGEGVLGFQRALRVAGCHASILSLWDLPDRPTRELVTAFYRNYRGGSSSPAQSLRNARTEILLSQRSHGRSTHPFNWGGLVAVTARE